MQMKRRTIWSTAVATAAATTTTVLFCSPSSGDSVSRRDRKFPFAMASAFSINKSLSSSGGTSTSPPSSTGSRLSPFSTALSGISPLSTNVTYCESESEGEHENEVTSVMKIPFDESVLSYDHYNGVTIHLDKYDQQKVPDLRQPSFATKLEDALTIWKAEGRKGIWIHASTESAQYIPDCINAGFQFHKILQKKNSDDGKTEAQNLDSNSNSNTSNSKRNNSLVLSQWLPKDTPSRLPHGPTHQVGVGVILLNPSNPSEMLVVKELSGPAAKYNLWKMPTGLVDPREYVPEAASRELLEETGIEASMSDILCIRQAHRTNADTSDMFFVCKMTPTFNGNEKNIEWKAQETEIADIRWMSVKDYCGQDRWQGSPLYETLNDCVLRASLQEVEQRKRDDIENNQQSALSIEHRQLEVGFDRTDGKSEALFLPQQQQSLLEASSKSKL
eukprot:CAMPEP_0197195912 /NCGR_PEP_ID=MMETSP1423-20130617/32072_1 /TAXON_ID=476441 /ORGANISM="Pseudo-nitzschia heimii, Strain UNC1101" /LENGTH=445 /DNA_ID=CAMNT_0042649675 /DNA_START=78 /DNA_END=1415 /DNA_ORIENTATION=-